MIILLTSAQKKLNDKLTWEKFQSHALNSQYFNFMAYSKIKYSQKNTVLKL